MSLRVKEPSSFYCTIFNYRETAGNFFLPMKLLVVPRATVGRLFPFTSCEKTQGAN